MTENLHRRLCWKISITVIRIKGTKLSQLTPQCYIFNFYTEQRNFQWTDYWSKSFPKTANMWCYCMQRFKNATIEKNSISTKRYKLTKRFLKQLRKDSKRAQSETECSQIHKTTKGNEKKNNSKGSQDWKMSENNYKDSVWRQNMNTLKTKTKRGKPPSADSGL